MIFFLVQRPDCSLFRPAERIDPAYAAALREVSGRGGVEIVVYRSLLGTDGADLGEPLPVGLE